MLCQALELDEENQDAAQTRAALLDSEQSTDAFGRVAGLRMITQAYQDFGIVPCETPANEAAARFRKCPPVGTTGADRIASPDYSQPAGSGIYLHYHAGQISIADILPGSGADLAGALRVGDRLTKINGIDLIDSFTTNQIHAKAYRLLAEGAFEVILQEQFQLPTASMFQLGQL